MTTRSEQLRQAAIDLQTATRTATPIEPLRHRIADLSLAEAYQIQQLQERSLIAAGEVVVGRKVGLTSFAMQEQLGVSEPDFGFFTASVLYGADATVDASKLISPKVEPEFAFKLGTDLTGPTTLSEAAAAIASVHAAIEVIDSRIENWNITLVDTVADNASLAAVVLSDDPLDVDVANLGEIACELKINDERVGRGYGRDVLGDPVAAVAWLATTFGEQGVTLRAGDIILPGSFCAAHGVEPGMRASADFRDLGA
ncbi:MAG: fumarylacetoacetate hydrolase family protein, partial [Bowdeniella nasicola]|nr:fumarylacetoacetate hydrolase family protein [Bowdeniella nasicola]